MPKKNVDKFERNIVEAKFSSEDKQITITLKENHHGPFLKIAEFSAIRRKHDFIMIPGEGIPKFLEHLAAVMAHNKKG